MGLHPGEFVADDQAYQRARGRKVEILGLLQDLQKELRDIDEFLTLYGRFAASGDAPEGAGVDTRLNQLDRKRQRNFFPPARLAEMCHMILVEAGRPMTRTELLAALHQRGIPVAGVDPAKTLGTILWRHRDEFENLPQQGYWIRGIERSPG